MENIFNFLYNSLYANTPLALTASFLWGLASVILSPCHLSSIPLIIAMMTGKNNIGTKKAFYMSFIFSIGILLSIALIGLITALLGRMMGDLGPNANLIFGIALILGAVLLLDIIPLNNISFLNKLNLQNITLPAVFLAGLLFGLALGPCSFAFMAPVLTLVFGLATTNLLNAILIITLYAIGHCAVIVFAGTSISKISSLLNWNQKSNVLLIIKRFCAVLVIVAGLYLIFK